MINIFFRFWKNFSVLIITITFLFCYSNLPDNIAVAHNNLGKAIKFIDKQTFFYWTAGVIFVFNLLMALLAGQLSKIQWKNTFSSSDWASKPEKLIDLIKGWIDAFVAIVNTFLVFVLLGLNNINANDNQKLDFNYNWLLLIAAFLLIVIIFSLPLKLLFTSPSKNEH